VTSARTSEANRRTALKSIGPKSQEEEKAVVCLNALGHGLLSREVLLPGVSLKKSHSWWHAPGTMDALWEAALAAGWEGAGKPWGMGEGGAYLP
jgi:hypothetical protein